MHIKKERRCIACKASKQKQDLIRVAKLNNTLSIDYSSFGDGRGAYICKDKNCIELTIKKKLLNRAFKSNLDSEIYIKLGEYEQNN